MFKVGGTEALVSGAGPAEGPGWRAFHLRPPAPRSTQLADSALPRWIFRRGPLAVRGGDRRGAHRHPPGDNGVPGGRAVSGGHGGHHHHEACEVADPRAGSRSLLFPAVSDLPADTAA